MPVKAGYPTPMLHVADIERARRFYERLGYETIDTMGEPVGWARLHCEGGAIMLFRSEGPLEPGRTTLPIYMYTADLPALRAQLLAAGVDVSAIRHPEHMPSGEMRVVDPDGHLVLVGHWSDEEHAAWLRHLDGRKPRGGGE
jgi:catechol 2,3-dioxygenase-like lactoylglutathione lyase family enzyme